MMLFASPTTRARRFVWRSLAAFTVVTPSTFAASVYAPSTSFAGMVTPEKEFALRINEARVAAGLPTLIVSSKLVDQARSWSHKMSMASGPNLGGTCQLAHNPKLAREVSLDWKLLGENVGCGATNVQAVHQAFMDSPAHRKNILDPKFDALGVAIVTSETTMFVTEVFMQTASGRSAKSKVTPKIKAVVRSRRTLPPTL
jgi:uncharacterized protein YkwD